LRSKQIRHDQKDPNPLQHGDYVAAGSAVLNHIAPANYGAATSLVSRSAPGLRPRALRSYPDGHAGGFAAGRVKSRTKYVLRSPSRLE